MSQFFAQLLHFFKDLCQFSLVFLNVKAGDTAHRECKEFFHIFIGHISSEHIPEGSNALVDLGKCKFVGLTFFDPLVDTVFKEDLCQSLGVEEFSLPFKGDLQLPFQVVEQFFGVPFQDFTDRHDARTSLPDHCQIDGNGL